MLVLIYDNLILYNIGKQTITKQFKFIKKNVVNTIILCTFVGLNLFIIDGS